MLTWLFRLLRWQRDLTAIRKGRIAQRVTNRVLAKANRRVMRKLWR